MTIEEQRQAIIAEAFSWINTPYHLNARIKGVGVDCGNFVLAAFVNAGLVEDADLGDRKPDFHLHRGEEIYLKWLDVYCRKLDESEDILSGDIVVFQFGRIVAHGAIVTEWPEIIHIPYKLRVMTDRADLEPLKSRCRGFYRLKAWEE